MENKDRPVIIIISLPSVCSFTELQLGLQLFNCSHGLTGVCLKM